MYVFCRATLLPAYPCSSKKRTGFLVCVTSNSFTKFFTSQVGEERWDHIKICGRNFVVNRGRMRLVVNFDPFRSQTAVESSAFVHLFWCEYRALVLLLAFLDINSGHGLFLTCTSFYIDRTELSLSRTARIFRIQVDDWEVPSLPVEVAALTHGG